MFKEIFEFYLGKFRITIHHKWRFKDEDGNFWFDFELFGIDITDSFLGIAILNLGITIDW